jgi:hypothetical protein
MQLNNSPRRWYKKSAVINPLNFNERIPMKSSLTNVLFMLLAESITVIATYLKNRLNRHTHQPNHKHRSGRQRKYA